MTKYLTFDFDIFDGAGLSKRPDNKYNKKYSLNNKTFLVLRKEMFRLIDEQITEEYPEHIAGVSVFMGPEYQWQAFIKAAMNEFEKKYNARFGTRNCLRSLSTIKTITVPENFLMYVILTDEVP